MIARYRKSVAALLFTVGTWGATASVNGLDDQEWFGLIVALAGVIAVWGIANDRPAGEPYDPTISEREAGAVDATTLATACLVIIAVVAVFFFFGAAPVG